MRKIYLFALIAATCFPFVACEKGNETVSVTGVTLNRETLSLEVEVSETLIAEVLPADATDQTVTWSSSNTSVATVDAGVVTAVAPGDATITVTTVEGRFKDECLVTVEVPKAQITHSYAGDIRFGLTGEGEATIDWGDGSSPQTVTLVALESYAPGYYMMIADAIIPHTYADDSEKTITVTGGEITGLFTGQTKTVTNIDVTVLKKLKYIDISVEILEAVDFSKNSELANIYCWQNNLTSIDVSGKPDLFVLSCESNNLEREALVDIFNDLPFRAEVDAATIWCGGSSPGNPGFGQLTADDYKIAEDKFWGVFSE